MMVDFKQKKNKFKESYLNIYRILFSGNNIHLYYRDKENRVLRQAHLLFSDLESLEITVQKD